MKYLIITPRRYGTGHEVEEFETAAELTAHLLENALPHDVIVAQRLGLNLQVCEWTAPAAAVEEIPEAAAEETKEAAQNPAARRLNRRAAFEREENHHDLQKTDGSLAFQHTGRRSMIRRERVKPAAGVPFFMELEKLGVRKAS